MPEKFEVTLVGNDQIGGMIDSVNDKVKSLNESTQKASTSLSGDFAGRDAQAGLSQLDEKFSSLANSAKKNVQNIGDMVPPLKNFGELSGKYLGALGRFGLAGGAVYAVTSMANATGRMAEHAYNLNVSAQNMGLTAEKLSMITGAYRLAGVDEQAALQSASAISDTFNDILRGGDAGNRAMSQLTQMGLSRDMIPTRRDAYGNEMVIIDELLPVVERIYDSIYDPQTRHLFAQTTGIDASAEALFNSRYSVQQAYNRAYEVGIVRLQETNDNLNRLNSTLNETSASMGGWWNRTKENLLSPFYEGGAFGGVTSLVGKAFENSDGISWGDIGGALLPSVGAWNAVSDIVNYVSGEEKTQVNIAAKDYTERRASPYSLTPAMDINAFSYINNAPQDVKQQWLSYLEQRYGLPSGVLDSVWRTESGRGRNLISPAGAEGPFQFMPSIGPRFGLDTVEDRMDFVKSSEAAARYLSQNAIAFNGDMSRTVASFNYGGAWNRWGQPMPIETQNYIASIMPGLPARHNPRDYNGLNATQGSNAQLLADEFSRAQRPLSEDIAQAINQNPTQITLRIVGDRGEQSVNVQSGGTVTTSMDL